MFKLRQIADLKRKYFITTHRLKLFHCSMLAIFLLILLCCVWSIRGPNFIHYIFTLFIGGITYKFHKRIQLIRYQVDTSLIIRESLLYVLLTNRLYTTCTDNFGNQKIIGRQSGFFILISAQQFNASTTLSTALRDNLSLRIALGANSSEGYRMVFGTATPNKIKPIEVKGAGYLYMQGSGKEYAQYWESPYLDTSQFNFIKELQLYL